MKTISGVHGFEDRSIAAQVSEGPVKLALIDPANP